MRGRPRLRSSSCTPKDASPSTAGCDRSRSPHRVVARRLPGRTDHDPQRRIAPKRGFGRGGPAGCAERLAEVVPSEVSSETRRAFPVTVVRQPREGPKWGRSVDFEWAPRGAPRSCRKVLVIWTLPKDTIGGAGPPFGPLGEHFVSAVSGGQ